MWWPGSAVSAKVHNARGSRAAKYLGGDGGPGRKGNIITMDFSSLRNILRIASNGEERRDTGVSDDSTILQTYFKARRQLMIPCTRRCPQHCQTTSPISSPYDECQDDVRTHSIVPAALDVGIGLDVRVLHLHRSSRGPTGSSRVLEYQTGGGSICARSAFVSTTE
ncbi:hypothetical protein OH76DRAFT_195701 [Lentinus brumalis]|uniref:Uncharacterized protein n=1 Tax=Lentinus brumalis TaxID=2498619 RepID=A0A371DI12_9APHY|nr:hypothetical protein OH76DRAFT_195701 [Polyporus brumalis]